MNKTTKYTEQREMVMKELRRFQRLYRLQIMCDFFNGGAVLSILLVLSAVLYKITYGPLHIPLWIFASVPFFAALFSLLNPLKISAFASKIDRKLGLEERLITAVHFYRKKEDYAILLFNDTLNRMRQFEPRLLFPMQWSRTMILLPLLGGVLFFYHFQDMTKEELSKIPHITQDTRIVMQKEGAMLTELADKLKKDLSFTEPWEKDLVQKLGDAGDKLQFESPGKHDTLLMLSDLSSSINKHYEEKSISTDASGRDNAYSAPVEERLLPPKEDAVKEVLDSLQLAKSHIAEADLEGHRNHTGHTSTEQDIHSPSPGKSISGISGESELPGPAGNSSAAGSTMSRGSNISGRSDNRDLPENLAFPPEGIILKYRDSIIPIESVPGKYHRIIIKYFDAVSGEYTLQKSKEYKN